MSLRFSGNHAHQGGEEEAEDTTALPPSANSSSSASATASSRYVGEGVAVACDWCFAQLYSSFSPPAYPTSWHRCWQCPGMVLCLDCKEAGVHDDSGHPTWVDTSLCMGKVKGPTLAQSLRNAFRMFEGRPCLGWLPLREGRRLSDIVWLTYGQLYAKSLQFGSGLRSLVDQRDFVGLSAKNRLEWYVTDYACFFHNVVSVPIHTSFDEVEVAHVVNNSSLKVVITSADLAGKYVRVSPQCPTLKHIVLMERPDEALAALAAQYGVALVYWYDLYAKGQESPVEAHGVEGSQQLITLFYTSGSTGKPKGAVITDQILNDDVTTEYGIPDPFVTMSFAPLAHSERVSVLLSIMKGGRIAIFSHETDRLFEAFAIVKPSIISSVPRLFNKLYSEYQSELARIEQAEGNSLTRKEQERELLLRFKQSFGGATQMLISGGAPIAPTVLEWLKRCFECPVYEGYGTTEVGPIATNGWIHQSVDVRLEDVPELGYFTTDSPYPRGEIWVRTNLTVPAYYRNEEETERAFKDGWFCTGDIGERTAQGCVRIIDRRKHIFKLAQGEFVAPERLENVLMASPLVQQIFVHGDSMRSFLVAVVVPNESALRAWAAGQQQQQQQQLQDEPDQRSLAELCRLESVRRAILSSLSRIISQSGRPAWEAPKGILLDHEAFTDANGLLTPSEKLNRRALLAHYGDRLAALYESLEKKLEDVRGVLVADVLPQALGDVGGLDHEGTSEPLINDSLSAVRLMQVLRDRFQVEVGVEALYSGNVTVDRLTDLINFSSSSSSSSDPSASSPAALPSFFVSSAPMTDWEAEAALAKDLRPVHTIESSAAEAEELPGHVLLTGCTGFLGVVLLHELLHALPTARIHCLIRARDGRDALARIRRSMEEAKLPLAREDEERLVLELGDLGQPNLGLSAASFAELSHVVEVVYHCGALVSAVHNYERLRPANVVGTLEVLRLCCQGRAKRLEHISTISVLDACPPPLAETVELDPAHIARLTPYSQSKYVAELLVRAVHGRGLPVRVYRPGTIGGHSATGFSNRHDFVNRLLCGMVQLGACPRLGADVGAAVNMCPVDYVAKAIVGISLWAEPPCGGATPKAYHLVNEHSLPLGEAVEQLKEILGVELREVGYDEWRTALCNAPETNVLLPLAAAFRPSGFPRLDQPVDCSNTLAALDSLARPSSAKFAGGVMRCPKIDKTILAGYMAHLQGLGFLQRPSAM